MSGPPRRLAVLESKVAAHSGYYLADLARHWQPPVAGAELVFVLPPTFRERHPDAFAVLAASESRARGIDVRTLAPAAWPTSRDPIPRLRRLLRVPGLGPRLRFRLLYLARWRALRRELVALRADAVLVMSLDDLLLAMLLAPPPAGVTTAGILFKPSFHYGALEHDERTAGERIAARIDRLLLARLARRPEARLLTLDPLAARALRSAFGDRVSTLPEPARSEPPAAERVAELARRLSIDPRRTCFLLLGALDARRGLPQVLAAVGELDAASAGAACLLLAGTLPAAGRERALATIERLRASSPCQVVLAEGTIAEHELAAFFHLADVVLVTHHRHVGSSGTLLHAAAAGRPVVATRAGLIGHLVRTWRLGTTVDSASPAAIAEGMRRALAAPREALFDAASAARLAAASTPHAYARAVLAAVWGDRGAGDGR